MPFLVEPFVDRELVAFAKKSFHCFRREMAMPRADIHDQWIRGGSGAREWLSKPGINRLPDQVLDDSTVRRRLHCLRHYDGYRNVLKTSQTIYCNIYQILS